MQYKTMILPIIAILALGLKAATGVEIDQATQESIATGAGILVAAGLSIYGVFKNHKKDDKK